MNKEMLKKQIIVMAEDKGMEAPSYFDSLEEAEKHAEEEAEECPGLAFHVFESVSVFVASKPRPKRYDPR